MIILKNPKVIKETKDTIFIELPMKNLRGIPKRVAIIEIERR